MKCTSPKGFGGNKMKRNVKNDKVIKAMTIGLAAMIAATSAPVNVYADEPADNVDQGNDDVQEGEQGGGEQESSVSVSEVTAADPAIAVAEELVSAPAQADGVMTADAVVAPGGLIPVAETAVEGLLVLPAEGQTAEQTPQLPGVENALDKLDKASDKVGEVKADLAGFEAALAADGQTEAAPIEAVKPGLSVEDGGITGKDIQVLNTSESEEYYEDETPVGGENVDHYDEAVNGNTFHSAAEDKKPFVKSIVDDYTEAYDNFQSFLSDNSDESKIKAFDAAARADEKLTKQENKIKELDEAIKDSAAAEEALKKAKDELNTVKTIRDKYVAVMTEYFRKAGFNDSNKKAFNEDGSINISYCKEQMGESTINAKAESLDKNVMMLSRSLLRELVTVEIKKNDGTNIDFNGTGDKNEKPQDTLEGVVFLNHQNHDQVASQSGNHNQAGDVVKSVKGDQLYQIAADKNLKDGGRTNRFVVTYIDDKGVKQTAYYNYVLKNTNKGDKELDLENGIFYLAQITQDENGKWVANQVDTLYDDFKLYANGGKIDAALKAVEAAEQKSAELKDAVNAIRNKVLGVAPTAREEFDGNDDEYKEYLEGFNAEYDSMFEDLKVATKYSRVKLSALRELIGERPVITTDDEDTSDDTSDDTPSTVIPGPGGFTYTIPGGYTLPSGMLDAFGGTGTTGSAGGGGTASGVLGERVPEEAVNAATPLKYTKLPALKKNNTNKKAKLVKIEDPETPLASMPMEDSVEFSWWWLLLIFLLGATGKKMYDNYQEKKREEEAAKLGK